MTFTKGHKLWDNPKSKKTWFKKGHTSPNKGHKGIHLSPKTEFKKGAPNWWKGKKRGPLSEERKKQISESLKGGTRENIKTWHNEGHPRWKGEDAGYVSKHMWVRKHKGKPLVCEHCGVTREEKRLSWANKDHKYRRVLSDYIPLCYPCHKKYDIAMSNKQVRKF